MRLKIILVVIVVIMALSGCTAPSVVTQIPIQTETVTLPQSEEYSPGPVVTAPSVEKKSQGNSYVQVYDGKVYFTDNKYMYVMNEDGTDVKTIAKIYDEAAFQENPFVNTDKPFIVYNDQIYYGDEAARTVCRMQLDGSNNTVLADDYMSDSINIINGRIYYEAYKDDSVYEVVMDLSGGNRKITYTQDDLWGYEVIGQYDGWIYYKSLEILGKRRADDSEDTVLLKHGIGQTLLEEGILAYTCFEEDSIGPQLYCEDLKTGKTFLMASISDKEYTLGGQFDINADNWDEVAHDFHLWAIRDGWIYYTPDYYYYYTVLFRKKISDAPQKAELLTNLNNEKAQLMGIDFLHQRVYYDALIYYNDPEAEEDSYEDPLNITRTEPLVYSTDLGGNDYREFSGDKLYDCFISGDYVYFESGSKLLRFNYLTGKFEPLPCEDILFGESEGD